MKKKIINFVYVVLGFISVGFGITGVVLPILPTTPFLLLATYFFAKGSTKFHNWFVSTKLYKKHLEKFIQNRAMTLKKKLTILLPVSTMLIITAICVNNIYAYIGITILIIFKYYYFFAHIATIKPCEEQSCGLGQDLDIEPNNVCNVKEQLMYRVEVKNEKHKINLNKKIEKEKKIVGVMIHKYCKGNKHDGYLCDDCQGLINYVNKRIDYCLYMETKTFCNNCPTHCYKKDMKQKIKEVMRYAGPRMILSHPIITTNHLYQTIKHNIKQKNKIKKDKKTSNKD